MTYRQDDTEVCSTVPLLHWGGALKWSAIAALAVFWMHVGSIAWITVAPEQRITAAEYRTKLKRMIPTGAQDARILDSVVRQMSIRGEPGIVLVASDRQTLASRVTRYGFLAALGALLLTLLLRWVRNLRGR